MEKAKTAKKWQKWSEAAKNGQKQLKPVAKRHLMVSSTHAPLYAEFHL